eukprot:scaffold20608_cov140-Isochrysis_galbana.AAC.5
MHLKHEALLDQFRGGATGTQCAKKLTLALRSAVVKKPIFGLAWSSCPLTRAPLLRPYLWVSACRVVSRMSH